MPIPRLIVGARVRSFAPTTSVRDDDHAANAVLCGNDGRIIAVGRAETIASRAPAVERLDLAGATLTPGLTDAHIHLTEWAVSRRQVDLADARSPEDAVRRVADYYVTGGPSSRGSGLAVRPGDGSNAGGIAHAGSGAAGWVCGRGWSRERWAGAEPHRAVLDASFPHTPVALQSHDMHALWVNTAALRASGIGADTADPPGGRIVRDGAGEPTGLLLENAGQLVIRHIPPPAEAEMVEAVLEAQAHLHRLGITGVHSLPGIAVPRPDPLSVLETLRAKDRLRLRVLQHLPLEFLDDAIRLGLRSGFGGDWIRIGGIKMFLDGSLGSRTAWMREPYEDGSVPGGLPARPDPSHSPTSVGSAYLGSEFRVPGSAASDSADRGVNVLAAEAFRAAVRNAAKSGLATTVHAIGDAAVALAIDGLADPAVRVAAMPHRIEHVQCLPCDWIEALEGPPHPDPLPHVGERAYSALEEAAHVYAHSRAGKRAYSALEDMSHAGAHSRAGQGAYAWVARAGRAGIVCSVQPAHLITDWRAADRLWGSARGARTYAFRTLLEAGAVIACGSDAPVEPVDPRLGLFAAVTRTDLDHNPPGGWHPAQRIGIEDVFRGYTIGPALAAGRLAESGALTRGAFADIVAWNADPLEDDTDPLTLECVATIVGGEPVYVR